MRSTRSGSLDTHPLQATQRAVFEVECFDCIPHVAVHSAHGMSIALVLVFETWSHSNFDGLQQIQNLDHLADRLHRWLENMPQLQSPTPATLRSWMQMCARKYEPLSQWFRDTADHGDPSTSLLEAAGPLPGSISTTFRHHSPQRPHQHPQVSPCQRFSLSLCQPGAQLSSGYKPKALAHSSSNISDSLSGYPALKISPYLHTHPTLVTEYHQPTPVIYTPISPPSGQAVSSPTQAQNATPNPLRETPEDLLSSFSPSPEASAAYLTPTVAFANFKGAFSLPSTPKLSVTPQAMDTGTPTLYPSPTLDVTDPSVHLVSGSTPFIVEDALSGQALPLMAPLTINRVPGPDADYPSSQPDQQILGSSGRCGSVAVQPDETISADSEYSGRPAWVQFSAHQLQHHRHRQLHMHHPGSEQVTSHCVPSPLIHEVVIHPASGRMQEVIETASWSDGRVGIASHVQTRSVHISTEGPLLPQQSLLPTPLAYVPTCARGPLVVPSHDLDEMFQTVIQYHRQLELSVRAGTSAGASGFLLSGVPDNNSSNNNNYVGELLLELELAFSSQ
ncbi:uncharacterized protein BJ171DRAFT_634205 [Polychytrium aggregatum]|uniref:uncharacterized protein n=1 Tax=Polychytrium aggregatum TaxID=110093 RepID=UPI0022FEE3CC|nr:uncharacterized protein BJ171DRAFT_634205 [Polychytrium aggregatum]KAI9208307.1 hypothetical protein BJ171DRAFT_634205 [Polychytrium aggregatum]